MLRKILYLVSFPLIAMPLIYQQASPVSAANNQRLLLSSGAGINSLLISSSYDKDYNKECSRKYQEAYQNIERNRRDLYSDRDDGDRRRHRDDLDRNLRKLQDLRNRYPDCDYHNRGYNRNTGDYRSGDYRDYRNRDYNGNYRDYRNGNYNGNYREYRDYPPGSLPAPVAPLPPRPPQY